jgi:hypothetical protein
MKNKVSTDASRERLRGIGGSPAALLHGTLADVNNESNCFTAASATSRVVDMVVQLNQFNVSMCRSDPIVQRAPSVRYSEKSDFEVACGIGQGCHGLGVFDMAVLVWIRLVQAMSPGPLVVLKPEASQRFAGG